MLIYVSTNNLCWKKIFDTLYLQYFDPYLWFQKKVGQNMVEDWYIYIIVPYSV